MIPSNLKERQQIIAYMLNALEGAEALTKWEEDFVASIAEQFDAKKNLSDKQAEKLEQIYDRIN